MTEEELKKKEEDLNKKEDRLAKAEKGLSMKIRSSLDKAKILQDSADVVKLLQESGVKDVKSLQKILDKKEIKEEITPKKGEVDMTEEQIKQIVADSVSAALKDTLTPIKEQAQKGNSLMLANAAGEEIDAFISKLKGKDAGLIKNYYKNDKKEVLDAYAQAKENDPNTNPEQFVKGVNEYLENIVSKTQLIKEEAKEEAKEDKKHTIDADKVSSDTPPAEKAKVDETNPMTKFAAQQDKADEILKEAQEMTEEQQPANNSQ